MLHIHRGPFATLDVISQVLGISERTSVEDRTGLLPSSVDHWSSGRGSKQAVLPPEWVCVFGWPVIRRNTEDPL